MQVIVVMAEEFRIQKDNEKDAHHWASFLSTGSSGRNRTYATFVGLRVTTGHITALPPRNSKLDKMIVLR